MKRLILVILSATAIIMGLTLPANANGGEICAQSGTGYCLNTWGGGLNNPVKMNTYGSPNSSFGNYQLTTMCGHGTVTGTCPFANYGLDSVLYGDPIVAVKSIANNLCVGSGQNDSRALMEPCPDSSGNGGGWGVVMVEDFGNCSVHLDDKHWTDVHGSSTSYGLFSGGAIGATAYYSSDRSGSSCWG